MKLFHTALSVFVRASISPVSQLQKFLVRKQGLELQHWASQQGAGPSAVLWDREAPQHWTNQEGCPQKISLTSCWKSGFCLALCESMFTTLFNAQMLLCSNVNTRVCCHLFLYISLQCLLALTIAPPCEEERLMWAWHSWPPGESFPLLCSETYFWAREADFMYICVYIIGPRILLV